MNNEKVATKDTRTKIDGKAALRLNTNPQQLRYGARSNEPAKQKGHRMVRLKA